MPKHARYSSRRTRRIHDRGYPVVKSRYPVLSKTPLTAKAIDAAQPQDKPYKLTDSLTPGLFLLVHPNGSKYWRFRYWLNKREFLQAIGVYPLITLKEARSAPRRADPLLPMELTQWNKPARKKPLMRSTWRQDLRRWRKTGLLPGWRVVGILCKTGQIGTRKRRLSGTWQAVDCRYNRP